jgi:glycosyltransferase 2 family protein
VKTAPRRRAESSRLSAMTLLAAVEPGRRNRRTIDAVALALGALLTGSAAVLASEAPGWDRDIAEALDTLLGWADGLWRAAFIGAFVLAVLIAAAIVVRRRWALGRDVLFALVVVIGVSIPLGRLVESDWFAVDFGVWSPWGFPEVHIACVTALVAVTAPELARPVRLLADWLVVLGALGAVVLGAAHPSGALAALALGLAASSLVRLVFGSAAGVPATERVRDALDALGVEVADLVPSARQQIGAAEYVGHGTDGAALLVRVLGRDAQDTQRIARQWRLLAYRDPPRSVAPGRLEQVEHEALAILMADEAGVRVPHVVTAALGPDGDAVIVTRQPDAEPLERASPDQVTDAALRRLWGQVALLHGAGISHGRLNAGNVVLDDGVPVLVGLAAATLAAPQSAIDIDVAELLVASTVLVGAERALPAAIDGIGEGAVRGALPYLQRAALSPHVRDLARAHEVALDDLRTAAAGATGAELAKPPPLHRIRLRDLLVTALVAVAAYLLIKQLAQIGFGTIADELRGANLAWVLLGLILAQLALVAGGVSLRGAVATPLPLWPCVVLQSALKVVNLTIPGSAGRVAFNVRFLQRMGAPTAEALSAGAVDDISETVVQVLIVVALLPLVDIDVDASELAGGASPGTLVLTILGVLAAVIVVVLAVPKLRAKVLPAIRPAFTNLWTVARTRRKRLELFGGNLGSELCYALCLGSVCLAYGVDLNLAQLLVVNVAASALSSLVPVPGGVGAEEAALTAGLVAMGVDESTAFAIALTHRFCTYYLPPIWGAFALRWLGRKGYV